MIHHHLTALAVAFLLCSLSAGASPAAAPAAEFEASAAVKETVGKLVAQHGAQHETRIRRGVEQAAAQWRPADGSTPEFVAFAAEHLQVDAAQIDSTFAHLERAMECMDGSFTSLGRDLHWHMDVETGPILPVDRLLAAYDPTAHLNDDLFASKIAIVALLNFPVTTLAQRLQEGPGWTRRQWAEARLTGRFTTRVPAAAQQAVSSAVARADAYVSAYNIHMHHLLTPKGERLFPPGLRLISHWNLRDELKAQYANKDGLPRQRMIAQVMEAIVRQTIPGAVIDNPRLDWLVANGELRLSPEDDAQGSSAGPAAPRAAPAPSAAAAAPDNAREPDTRYALLLSIFHAMQEVDRATPLLPTHVARTFEHDMEIPQAEVIRMLEQLFAGPAARDVAQLIRHRLSRKLEPFDIWYAGFKPRSRYDEAQLDAATRQRYPTPATFEQDLPRMLHDLGFGHEQAQLVTSHVVVDPSRGAGHALAAARRDDRAHLRTRVGPQGMDYKGYNIAVHEFGHNVEQVFSLNAIDHTLLAGVPASAFTEALAFVFQGRDLQLLGLDAPDELAQHLHALEEFWGACEIAAVALVDIGVWQWMYEHPTATPAQLREATVGIAQDVWNRTFAPLIGVKDSVLLAIYSHMLDYPLYLPNYPLGHLIAFQLEEHFRTGDLAKEFERVCRQGRLTPDLWMRQAVGASLSPQPLIEAAERAVKALQK
jgi:hypothetical protein